MADQTAEEWQIVWTCELTCSACQQALYFQTGMIPGRLLSDKHLAERGRIIAEAFATYAPHSAALFHHVGGRLSYHERQM